MESLASVRSHLKKKSDEWSGTSKLGWIMAILERDDVRFGWVIGNWLSRDLCPGVSDNRKEWLRLVRLVSSKPRWPGLHLMSFYGRVPIWALEIPPSNVFFVSPDGLQFFGDRFSLFTTTMKSRPDFLAFASGPGLRPAIDAFMRADRCMRADMIDRFFRFIPPEMLRDHRDFCELIHDEDDPSTCLAWARGMMVEHLTK
jgi:hypothetical protein